SSVAFPLEPGSASPSRSCAQAIALHTKRDSIATGSNTGIGYETAKGLTERGYRVVLACRSQEKGEVAARRIKEHLESMTDVDEHFVRGGEAMFLCPLDLSSLALFCKAFNEQYGLLNVLVNNAGTGSKPGRMTEDGLELIFQSNLLGLTKLFLKPLQQAKNKYHAEIGMEEEAGRIINLSSVMHHFSPANKLRHAAGSLKDASLDTGVHDKQFWLSSATGLLTNTYSESKLAVILFTMELKNCHGAKGIRSVAVDPGVVFSSIWRKTDLWCSLPKSKQPELKKLLLNTQQGSRTSVAGAVGAVPKDVFYLQPYWQPKQGYQVKSCLSFRLRYACPHPITEATGPYVGFTATQPRLPADGSDRYRSSWSLWNVCKKLTESSNRACSPSPRA
ncbi:hypothetical protein ACHAWF_001776, partial [Thalassiosira exigua]